jgi:hypothetical protein
VRPTAARSSARSSGLRARISTRRLSRNTSTAEYFAASDMAHNPAGSYCARTILTANGLRSKMTPAATSIGQAPPLQRHVYDRPQCPRQEVDHASTKSVGDEPNADDDARAWNPRMTCQGCRPGTHTSLDERGLVKCPLRFVLRNQVRPSPRTEMRPKLTQRPRRSTCSAYISTGRLPETGTT